MDWFRYTMAVAWKELQLLFKDRGAMALFFLLPLIISGLIAGPQIASWRSGGEESVTISLEVALLNADAGPYGQQVAAALQDIEVLAVETVAQMETVDQLVTDRGVDAGIIIPANFSQQIDAYTPTTVQLIVDPGQTQVAGIFTGILDSVLTEVNLVGEIRYGIRTILDESGILADADPAVRQGVEAQSLGVIMTQLNQLRQNPAITVVSEDMSGQTVTNLLDMVVVSMLPGVAVLFAFFVTTSEVNSFYTEKNQGSFRRLLAAPIPRWTIVAGKMLAFMVIVILQLAIMLGVANLFFQMPVGSSPLALILITVLLALVVTALGMMLTAVSRTEKQAESLGIILTMVLGGLGGCLAGIPEMFVFRSTSFLGTLARLTPQAHALEAYMRVMAEDGGVITVLPQLGALLGFAVLFFLIAAWRFRFD